MRAKRGGKKYTKASEAIEIGKAYSLKEALELATKLPTANFDESVDVALRLGLDIRQSDQQVRGAILLPHGSGKSSKICVFAKGENATKAEQAGADFVGSDDLVEKISGGWMDFDKVIATPDMMVAVSKVAKILGPRGLMPNPKLGTVTFEVEKAVAEQKKGKVNFRTDKGGIIHCMIGKRSFGMEKLKDNFSALLSAVIRQKPPTSKGTYLKNLTISTTMGPPISINMSSATESL